VSDLLSTDINDYCFIDTETKALPRALGTTDEDVSECGAYRYSECAKVIIITWAIGDGPVQRAAFKDFDPTRTFVWEPSFLPELYAFYERAQRGEAWFAAWNMQFDRLMLSTIPGCALKPEMTIDVMGQAAASNLPGKLEGASRAIGRHGKQADGKELIKLFCGADWNTVTPQTHPEEWARFCTYASQDIDELRAVFKATRPLPRREWVEYWASERINDRGMRIDVGFCERAAAVSIANQQRMNRRVSELTEDTITKVTQRERIANWLYDHSDNVEAREALVTNWVEDDEITGEDRELVPSKLSVKEDRLKAYINVYEHLNEDLGLTDAEADLLDIAYARLFGASVTPLKFQKALDQASADDHLRGQFRWNGAAQTGRYSSQGVQVHNLVRASLTDKEHPDREIEAIEMINSLEEF
jgi:DNA polymerase